MLRNKSPSPLTHASSYPRLFFPLFPFLSVVVLNKSPMLVSLIASENANTGQLLDMDRLMGSLLDALLPALLPDHLAPAVV